MFNFNYCIRVLCLLSSIILSAQTNFYDGSWEDIFDRAQTDEKLIFVDLFFTGCAPCAEMDKKVFPNIEVAAILNASFVSFKADILKDDIAKKLAMKYGVTGYPTYLFLNSKGKTINVISGYFDVDTFIMELKNIKLAAQNNIYKAYSTVLNGDYPAFYKNFYLENKRNISFETLDDYLNTQNDLSAEIPFVVMSGLCAGGKYEDFLLNHASELAFKYGRIPMRNTLVKVVKRKASKLAIKNNEIAFNEILKKSRPVFTKIEWEKFRTIFQQTYDNHKI